jgi:hypothetical protein
MNIIILVLIDDSKVSRKFKKVLLTNLCEYGHTYFLYGKTTKETDIPECMETMDTGDLNKEYNEPVEFKSEKYSDLYIGKQETFKNIIYKTVDTLQYLLDKGLVNEKTIVLRTNMSTLFDYQKFKKVLDNLSKTEAVNDLYAGPFIGGIGNVPMISGTAVLLGYNKILEIINNREKIDINTNEDVNLQMMIKFPFKTFNIPRIDYLDDTVLFHKCFKNTNTVFTFRFKSLNRETDTGRMEKLITAKFDTKTIDTSKHMEELPMYGELFKEIMTIHV